MPFTQTSKTTKAMPFTQTSRTTKDDPAGGGFLLLRLTVTSSDDLTDPRLVERLIQQLCSELPSHTPAIRVSLLRIMRT